MMVQLDILSCISLVVLVYVGISFVESTNYYEQAFERFNETIHGEGGYFRGLMSGAFSNINVTTSFFPWGARSAQSSTLFATDGLTYPQDTRGYLSLAWSDKVIHKNGASSASASCMAEAACYGINEMYLDGHKVFCAALRSCDSMYAVYDISNEVNAYGTFSMINSRLYAKGDGSTIDFYYYGYFAGYNSSIYCKDGDTCNLYCESNACVNLNFYCNETVSTCNVYCDNTDYCANGWNGNNNTNNNMNNSGYIYNIISLLNMDGDGSDGGLLTLLNKTYEERNFYEDCVENSQYTCPNSSSGINHCWYKGFVDSEGTSITDPICCMGYGSCYGATMTLNNENANVYCDTTWSCISAKMNLNYKSNIYVRGRFAIQYATITNFGKLIATAYEAMEGSVSSVSNVSNGLYLGCLGLQSCKNFNVYNVSYIYATGYQSLYNSDVYSNGTDVNIYLLGYESGYGLTLYCNKGDECNVYCLNGTNNECLNDITLYSTAAPSAAPTEPTIAPSIAPSAAPSLAPSSVPSRAPSIAPSQSPTAAPSDNYVNYVLMMNVSRKNESVNPNTIKFYVKLEGSNDDTDWLPFTMHEASIPVNNKWVYFNQSFNWTNVGYSNSRLTMVTYDVNDIIFNCFFVFLTENEKTYEQSICEKDTTYSISVTNEEYENGYCEYLVIDYFAETIKIKTSSDDSACPYDNTQEASISDSNNNVKATYIDVVTESVNIIVISVILLGGVVVIISILWTKLIVKNACDAPPKLKTFKFFLHLSDFWSDIGVALVWYLNGEDIFFIVSACALILSTLVSGYGAVKLTRKWKRYHNYSSDCPDRLVNYVTKYERTIYLLCLLAGLKPTLFLLQSKLFGHKFFNIPLKSDELGTLFKYQIAVVFAETIPELSVQIYYLYENGIGNASNVTLLILSLVLSVISILVEIMVLCGHSEDDSAAKNNFSKKTSFDFDFVINSKELKKHHIMTNGKLNDSLDFFFKDPSRPWQSKLNLCKFSLECYYIKDNLDNNEIEVHCQMLINTSYNNMNEMERNLNDCVKDVFDKRTENYGKFKTTICNKFKISFETATVTRSKSILIRHINSENSRKISAVRDVSTFDVISRSDDEGNNDNTVNDLQIEMEGKTTQ